MFPYPPGIKAHVLVFEGVLSLRVKEHVLIKGFHFSSGTHVPTNE